MLTPQDIQSKEFAKAVFGGFDMASVEDFLEELTEDYTTLYKENAILKGKIKVLVEKVEEYRSTEDAMRMALLTAQKMGDDIVEEAGKKRDEMLSNTEAEIENKRKNFRKEYEDELKRIDSAKNETLSFVKASQEIIARYGEFLSRLGNITDEFGASSVPEQECEPDRSPEPEAEREPKSGDAGEEMSDTIKGIDAVVSDALADGEAEEPEEEEEKTVRADAEPEQASGDSADDSPTRRIDWSEDDEITSPRPKFDFKDLKFGSNYFDE